MKWNTPLSWTTALGLSFVMASPVLAQNNEDYQRRSDQQDRQGQYQEDRNERDQVQSQRSQRDQQRDQQNRDQQNWQRDQRQAQNQQRSQDQRQRRMQFDLDGWVTIATDYDKDGRFDAMETIYLYDLERARKTSQARSKQRSQRNQQTASNQNRTLQTAGEIQSLSHKSMQQSDQKKVVAKLRTHNDRTATVCLGSKNKVAELDLQEGDFIRVKGKRSQMDGKSFLMAEMVATRDGQSIQNDLPKDRNLKRIAGKVESHREANFQGHSATFVVAKINSDRHGRKEVNLGPKQDLTKLNLKDGKQIKVLARDGRINDQEAWIAEAVHVDGQTVDVRGNTERSLKKDHDQQDRAQKNREMHRDQQKRDQSQDQSNADSYEENDRQANRENRDRSER